MRKEALIFVAVTLVALVAATLGHMFYPPFCMALKPMSWPFVTLAVLIIRRAILSRRDR